MATTRPSIYIGIGLTGIQAITKTRKMFEDAYGKDNIPHWIAFLAIDRLKIVDDPFSSSIPYDDLCQIDRNGYRTDYFKTLAQKSKCKWMFPNDSEFLQTILEVDRVPTDNRISTEMFVHAIESKIESLYNQFITVINSGTFRERSTDNKIECHIATSLSDVSKAGSFINVAQTIKDTFQDDAYIIGYGILHETCSPIDVTADKSSLVFHNGYSAILDLEYLMNATPEHPIKLTFNGSEKQLSHPVYDEFYVIDNEPEQGYSCDEKSKLCEVLGKCLYRKGNDVGSLVRGVKNSRQLTDGWSQSPCACRVVYTGNLLAEIIELKESQNFIHELQQKDTDFQQQALAWTVEANIRERGSQFNLIIDRIYEAQKINCIKEPTLEAGNSMTLIRAAVDRYLNNLPDFPGENEINNLTNALLLALRSKVSTLLNTEHGVGTSLGFLNTLKKVLNQFKLDLHNEWSVYDKKTRQAIIALEMKFIEFDECSKKLSAIAKEASLSEIIGKPSQRILRNKIEAARRKTAFRIFTKVIREVEIMAFSIDTLNQKLDKLSKKYQNELAAKQSTPNLIRLQNSRREAEVVYLEGKRLRGECCY